MPAPALDPKVKALVEEALAAIKKKDYGASLLPLAALRSIPELSVEQTSAVQDLYGNVQVRLAELADKGDTNAQKALDSIRGAARR